MISKFFFNFLFLLLKYNLRFFDIANENYHKASDVIADAEAP